MRTKKMLQLMIYFIRFLHGSIKTKDLRYQFQLIEKYEEQTNPYVIIILVLFVFQYLNRTMTK